jgi:hypothetical protein
MGVIMKKSEGRNKTQDMVDCSHFLTGMGLVMERHGIGWADVEIDIEKGIINIMSDLSPEKITAFLIDLQERAGDFD